MPSEPKRKKPNKTAAGTSTRRSKRISGADFLDSEAQVRSVKVFFFLCKIPSEKEKFLTLVKKCGV